MLTDQILDNAVYATLRELQECEGLVSCSPHFLRGAISIHLDLTNEISDSLRRLEERGLVEHVDKELWRAKATP